MNEPPTEPIEDGSTNRQLRERMLLFWAVSASTLAAVLFGFLVFQQPQTQVTGSSPTQDELPKSVPFSSSGPGVPNRITPANLEPPPVPPLPDIYISDLKPVRFMNGWGRPGVNQNPEGKPLRLGGKTYEHGLGAHAYSEAIFDIPADARRFVAVVGLDDQIHDKFGRGSVCFEVYGDANEIGEPLVPLDRSPVLSDKSIRTWAIDVKLEPRFKQIMLLVTDGGDGNECDWGDWGNAGFLKERATLNGMQ